MTVVRTERPGDIDAIRRLVTACFPTPSEAALVDLLRARGHLAVSVVADEDGAIVGHVAFSPVTLTDGRRGAGLAPLAVAPRARGRGTGVRLVETGLAACRADGFGWAVVLGDPGYYGRFGFEPASGHGLSDRYGGGAAYQLLELADGGLPEGGGLVSYGPEFAEAL